MKEITEDYVSFETAKLLKEKGFDERCDYEYGFPAGIEQGAILQKWRISHDGRVQNSELIDDACAAPTLQMAMKWLRVTYGYYIWVDYSRFDFDKNQPFLWNVVKAEIDGDYYGGTYHKTYEKACEAAIKYCLENLI